MFRLAPPPQFLLPPPPIPPSEFFDWKIVSQLTCSSIREEHQQTIGISPLILFTSASVVAAILLFTCTLICFFSSWKQSPMKNSHTKPVESMNDLSTCSNRSYETVSSDHTGIYVESIDTSVTTCSIDTTAGIRIECYHQHACQPTPYYHILSIPDVVPK